MGSISRVISQRFRGKASPGSSGGESPPTTSTSTNPCRSTTVPSSSSSPLRRKPFQEKPRKELRKQRSADELQIRGGLWPSAKNHPGPANVIAVATLRDHLINESKNEVELEEELEDGRRPIVGVATHAASTFSSRQRSGPDSPANLENNINMNMNMNMNMIGNGSRERLSRSSSLQSKKKKNNNKKKKKKQQKPGETPPSPSSSNSCSSFSGPISSAARLPADDNNENALSARRRRRRRSEFGLEFPSSTEFDRNDSRDSRSRAPIKIAGKVIRRSGSPVRSSKSPVLRNSRSPPVLHNSRSPVLRRPRTPPSKVMIGGGMGNIINMGLMGSLFRRKSFSGAAQVTTESSPAKEAINRLSGRRGVPEGVGSPARGSQAAVLELQHKLRMEHSHLMQWRFINGRMVAVNTNKWATAQKELVSAWVELLELQVAVTQKRLQLANHKLSFKLNTLISPQIKAVEKWGNMEKHHMAAISSTKDCLHAVVCRLPLSDRAKADPQILSILLRKATNLMTAINGNIATCNSMAQRTVPLVAQLAQLVSKEKPLIEECFELLEFVSKLQLREESLRCHLIQLKS